MITVIDYGMGNLKSLANAFQTLGEKATFAKTPNQIAIAERLVFPGVGNFGKAADILRKKKLDIVLLKSIGKGIPFLGICLGFQLLFETSEEASDKRGLGIFKGKIVRFRGIKTPHMGWNQLAIKRTQDIFKNLKSDGFAYFMHSFYAEPAERNIIAATTNYGIDFCSATAKGKIFGVQFHPEKSGEFGLQILKNFSELSC